MATFRKVHTCFWSDPFTQMLTPEQKYFYLYLITNDKTRQCGIYEITKRQMCYDTGYNIDTICKYIDFFIEGGKIRYNIETCEIAIKNWRKYNDQTSPKVQACINKELLSIKDTQLFEYMGYKQQNGVIINENYRITESLRKKIFTLYDNKCHKCKSDENLTTDHIIPRSIGGKSIEENLRCLCRSCNSSRPLFGKELIDEVNECGFDFNYLYKLNTGFNNYEYSIGSQLQEDKNKNEKENKNEIQNFNSFLEKIENPESFPEWKNSCSEFLNSDSFKDSYSKLKKVPIGNLEKVMMDFLLNVNGRGLFKDCAGLIAHFKNFYPKHVENKVNTPSFQNSKGFIDVPDNLDYDKMEVW